MKIRYSQSMGIIFLVVGIALVGIYFLVAWNMKYGSTIQLLGFMGIFWGVVFLRKTYFVVNDKSLVIYAILGSSEVTHTFKSLKELVINENKLYLVKKDGERQKINIQLGMVEKSDWQELRGKLKSASK